MNYQIREEIPARPSGANGQMAADEISIADLIRTLWRGRTLILLLPIIAAVFAGLVAVGMALRIDNPTIYYVTLNGIENNAYPNGTAFSPRDLTTPAVLAKLRQRYSIPDDVDLSTAIDVTYGNPITRGLTQAYRDRLSQSGLSVADVERINETYQHQIDDAVYSMLRIEVNHDRLNTDAETGANIARALPEIWSEHFSRNVRIFENTLLTNVAISRETEALEDTASILNAKQDLQAMQRGLGIIANDNRLAMLKTSDGFSIEDVREALTRFRTVQFTPLLAMGINAGQAVGAAYVQDLQLQLENLQQKLSSYDDTVQQLQTLRGSNEMQLTASQQREAFANNAFQLGESGLSKFAQLIERASLSDYTQELLNGRQQVAFQIADIRREMAIVSNGETVGAPKSMRQEAASALSGLSEQYSELLERAQERLRRQTATLYTPSVEPQTTGKLFSEKTVLLIVLSGAFGAFIAVILVLVRAGMRRELQRV